MLRFSWRSSERTTEFIIRDSLKAAGRLTTPAAFYFMPELNGYHLTTQWFKFCQSGECVVRPIHTALYLYSIHLCNTLKWKINFGLPTDSTMGVLGMKNKKTYYLILQDLIDFGFIKLVEKSINQHTANIICLPKKRISTHFSTISGTVPIVKRINIKTLVNDAEAQKTALFSMFKKVRSDIPDTVLIIEAGKFILKYPNKDIKKDINLINTWASKIVYKPEKDKYNEFEQTAKKNKEKYGS